MKHTIYVLSIFYTFLALAQQEKYPQNYFSFPIKPGQQNYLAGTMGELRSNHFHAGIDIKTDQQIGLPVYAPADGYISRIKISPYGYGNALYIKHPNGYTTVYGHLEDFGARIDSVVLGLQYEKQSFSIDQYFKKNQFKVKKGEIIAHGGNTGGSMGPHLHFEIRDKNQHVLNPLAFGFSEIKDNISPRIKQISLSSFGENSHVKNQFTTSIFTPKRINSKKYKIYQIIPVQGKIGIGLKAIDQLNGASNQNGVNKIVVRLDSKEIFSFHNTIFSFAKKLHLNRHIDYANFRSGKGRFIKCYLDDGNGLRGYETDQSKGYLHINDSLVHNVEIDVYDGYNNKTQLTFQVKGQKLKSISRPIAGKVERISHTIQENVLKITVQHKNKVTNPHLYINGKKHELKADYFYAGKSVYLWNLQNGMPDSINTITDSHPFHFHKKIPTPNSYSFYNKHFNVYFQKQTLFDTLYLEMKYQDDIFAFQNTKIPVAKRFTVLLKPEKTITNKAKTHVYEKHGTHLKFVGGFWKNNHIEFRTRTFGTYVLSTDIIPPTIKYLGKRNHKVSFRIRDRKSGIKSYNAKINGEWLLMKYDYKIGKIWSERLDKTKPLKGKLELEVIDEANNKKVYTITL